MQFVSLKKVLEYKNPSVIKRYRKEYKCSNEFANVMFENMLKFFWLSALGNSLKKPYGHIFSKLTPLDDMWHTFILFTRDYTDFGNKYFGYYMHHKPTMDKELKSRTKVQDLFFLCFGGAYDYLGEDTINSWYDLRPSRSKLVGAEIKQERFLKAFKSNFGYDAPKKYSFIVDQK